MLKTKSLANASAGLTAVIYLVCVMLAVVAPDTLRGLAQIWFHGFNWSSLPVSEVTASNFILGLITAVGSSWAAGYLFAWFYNKFASK